MDQQKGGQCSSVLALVFTLMLTMGVSTPLVAAGGAAGAYAAGAKKPVSGAKSAAAKATEAQAKAKASNKTASKSTPKTSPKTSAKPRPQAKKAKQTAQARRNAARRVAHRPAPPRASYGQLSGLRATEDDLNLQSSVALVVDQDTDEVLFSKNSEAVLPIASITKLMTALVVTEAQLALDETLVVTREDASVRAGSRSRLVAGARLTRGEMLHLALMASENRAAHLLGRTYPGGMKAFVEAMNAKAQLLGMHDTRYVEPTGLSSDNQSSARDLALLVRAASEHALLRELSTSSHTVKPVGRRQVQFNNTNGLVRNPEWDIGLQKTGYISAAGRCVVLQTQMAGRQLILVLLDSAGKYARMGDAERIRKWLSETRFLPELPALPLADALPSLPKLQGLGGRYVLPALPALPAFPAVPLAQGLSGGLEQVR
jgi:D-alanyl-D-alanine endopeptidase (penicillin-binding protein 7)